MGPPVGQALEFLSQVLSQRGPQAVPYAENTKWSIREHMSDLLKVRAGAPAVRWRRRGAASARMRVRDAARWRTAPLLAGWGTPL